MDYDDPEEVTRAILKLREQRERDAAERRPSRIKSGRSRAGSRDSPQLEQQNQMKSNELKQVEPPATKTSSNMAVGGQQLSHLQKSPSHASSHSGNNLNQQQQQKHLVVAVNSHTNSTQQRYRSPSPSLAQRQGPPAKTTSHSVPLQHTLSNQSSSSTENHYDSQQRKAALAPRGHQQQHFFLDSATPRIVNGPQLHQQQQQLSNHGQQTGSRKASPSPVSQQSHSQQQQPSARNQHTPVEEHDQPEGTLHQAEQRIDGLLRELEELRFFRDLEIECDQEQQQHQQPQKVLGAMRPSTPTNNGNSNPRIPLLIGVPTGQDSQPPPPPPPINFMDPRAIGKLDRHTLELEAQKMVRSIQLLATEKLAVEAEIQVLSTNTSQHKQRIQQLEQALSQVHKHLLQARKDMGTIQETVVQQYESKLGENVEKLQQTQLVLDTLKEDRDRLQVDMEQRLMQMTQREQAAKQNLSQERESAQAREAVLELQLAEVVNTVEELKRRLKEKDKVVDDLKRHVDHAQEALETVKQQQQEMYQEELNNRDEQLQRAENKYKEACDERSRLCQQLESHQTELESVREQCKDQAGVIAELTERLDLIHIEYRQKFGELKDVYETKEKRRLNEMVVSQSKQVEEYERRILDVQQQLTMATDRHHTEIRQKETTIENTLERERKRIREQVEDEHHRATELLKSELERTKEDYQEVETDRQRLRVANAAHYKELSTAQKTWEEKEKQGMQEIVQLRQQMNRLVNESLDKESQIKNLTTKMSERSTSHEERLRQMEKQHAADLLARDELIAEQKRKLRESELAVRNDLMRKDAEMIEAKALLKSRISELEIELQHANSSLEQTKKSLQSTETSSQKLLEVHASLEQAQIQLKNERIAHEGVEAEMRAETSKLASKLLSCESNLQDKLMIVEELELKMQRESETFAVALQNSQKEIDELMGRLSDAQNLLSEEHTKSEILATKIARLELEKCELNAKVEKGGSSEALNADLQTKIDELETGIGDLHLRNKDLAADNDTLRKAEEGLRADLVPLMAKIAELEGIAQNLRQENDDLQESSDAVEANIKKLRLENEDLMSRAARLPEAQEKIEDLNKQLSEQHEKAMQSMSELTQTKLELEDYRQRVKDYESKLDQTSNMTTDTEHNSSKATQLEDRLSQLVALSSEKEQLQKQHGQVEHELEEKIAQLKQLEETHSSEVNVLKEQIAELTLSTTSGDSQLRALDAELVMKTERLEILEKSLAELREWGEQASKQNEELRSKLYQVESELNGKFACKDNVSSILESQVEQLTRANTSLEVQLNGFQEQQVDREKQMQLPAERYSNQIVGLQMQVEDLTAAKSSLRTKLAETEEELEKTADMLRSTASLHAADLNSLRERLAEQIGAKSQLESRVADLEAQLTQSIRESNAATENALEEVQNRLDVSLKENRSLNLRIGDVERELDRKEKQVKEVVNRYSQEITALNDKLEGQTKEARNLQKELENLKANKDLSTCTVSNETSVLKERVTALERSIDVERALTRDAEKAKKRFEMELVAVETGKQELYERFEKVSSERNEVISALEEVIHEVQSREDEIDALAEALRRREHELEHAKMIASKALSSAQEIKARYKDRNPASGNDELENQVASLTSALGQAKKSNGSLQRKLARLEEELTRREGEYSELKEQLERSGNAPKTGKIDQFVAKSKPSESPLSRQLESASTAVSTLSDGTQAFELASQSIGVTETMSDVGASSDPWGMQQVSSGSTDSSDSISFAGVRTEPGDRRALERDALRKYVRKRYMSVKSTAST